METPIPLIHSSELDPVLAFLTGVGAPIEKLLTAASLPIADGRPAGEFVAAHAALKFAGTAALAQDVPDLGWRAVMKAPVHRLGQWGAPVARSLTLWDAIRNLCTLYPREVSFVQLGLTRGPEHAWLWRHRPEAVNEWQGDMAGEQFMLAALIQVVRLVAGPDWAPPHVRLKSQRSEWILRAGGLEGSRIEFGGPVMAIAVPYPLLHRRIPRALRTCATSNPAPENPTPATDFVGSLQQALTPFVGRGPLSIELGAEIARTSTRTLRRRLTREGSGWRQLNDRLHFEACDRMLRDPALTLSAIAAELGYSDQAHFNRAFRRWTGTSPSSYRAELENAGVPAARERC
jgi:AraC-like DNA-binding protein